MKNCLANNGGQSRENYGERTYPPDWLCLAGREQGEARGGPSRSALKDGSIHFAQKGRGI